jgi:mRNA-degrading endonuclease RelE of RelBE toxin-antitoxin system
VAKRLPFQLVYAPEVVEHLRAIERKHHRLIRQAIAKQLSHEPEMETRRRKSLRAPAPFEATRELRCGPGQRFRVFYDVDAAARTVSILAVGVKEREKLFIGGEEFKP